MKTAEIAEKTGSEDARDGKCACNGKYCSSLCEFTRQIFRSSTPRVTRLHRRESKIYRPVTVAPLCGLVRETKLCRPFVISASPLNYTRFVMTNYLKYHSRSDSATSSSERLFFALFTVLTPTWDNIRHHSWFVGIWELEKKIYSTVGATFFLLDEFKLVYLAMKLLE